MARMGKIFAALIMHMALEEIDQLGEWENSSMVCKDNRKGCDCDKERLGRAWLQIL